ncbi:hypothetical protein HDV00_006392, partial [Rhizophlyctis rosea]
GEREGDVPMAASEGKGKQKVYERVEDAADGVETDGKRKRSLEGEELGDGVDGGEKREMSLVLVDPGILELEDGGPKKPAKKKSKKRRR